MTMGPHVSEVCSVPAARRGREARPGRPASAAGRGAVEGPAIPAAIPPAGAARGRRAAPAGGGARLSPPPPPRLGSARRDPDEHGAAKRSRRRRFRRAAPACARPRACYVSRPARARPPPEPCPAVPPHGRGAYISVCVGSARWASGAPEGPSHPDDSVTRAEGSLLPGAAGTCRSKGTPRQEKAAGPCGAAAPKQAFKQLNELKWSLLGHR